MSSPDHQPRVSFVTDIMTPYMVAVFAELARMVDLTALFCSAAGTRGLAWRFDELPFRHRVVGGLVKRREDRLDAYLSPRILAALVRSRPQATISGGFSVPSMYAAGLCRARGIPLLIHSDGTAEHEAGFGRGQMLARALMARLSSGAVGNSEPAARRFAELGFDPVFRAPHSTILAPYWSIASERKYECDGALQLLGSGRLVPRKGFDRLVRAVADARAGGTAVELTLVGSGPEEQALRALADQLDVPLRLPGFLDQDQLPRAYAEADAYAFPTLDDPFGIVVLEALAAGLPTVASPRGGATEDLIRDGENGLVRDPGDLSAWSRAIADLAVDASLRERLGRAGRLATEHRTPADTARGYADAVAAALKPDRRGRKSRPARKEWTPRVVR